MKRTPFSLTLLAAAMLLSSCGYHWPGGISYTGAGVASSACSFDTHVRWTEASYDSNGFPIFGYYYGRPVYAYSPNGVAIFSTGAVEVNCYVPLWNPAPWYKGSKHYPHHVQAVTAPPRSPRGHRPGMRPEGGLFSPINRHPGSVFGRPGLGGPGSGH